MWLCAVLGEKDGPHFKQFEFFNKCLVPLHASYAHSEKEWPMKTLVPKSIALTKLLLSFCFMTRRSKFSNESSNHTQDYVDAYR